MLSRPKSSLEILAEAKQAPIKQKKAKIDRSQPFKNLLSSFVANAGTDLSREHVASSCSF
jgi:hypothetical protein